MHFLFEDSPIHRTAHFNQVKGYSEEPGRKSHAVLIIFYSFYVCVCVFFFFSLLYANKRVHYFVNSK